jgi:serine/threonine-protein kinase
MDLLEGEDFSKVCEKRGPLSVAEAALYVTQAGEAIRLAHLAGIVHRDIKPANLFLTHRADGSPCVKVLDFGISKQDDAADLDLTRAGEMLGSPPYMSPEQIRSTRSVDPRADVWALGAILYKLLTGRTPFHASTMPRVILSILDERPARAPSMVRPSLPAELDKIILSCLEKDSTKRTQNVSALLAALRPFCADPLTLVMTAAEQPPFSQRPRSIPPVSAPTPVWEALDTPARGQEETQPAHVRAMLEKLRSRATPAGEDREPPSRKPTSSSRTKGNSCASSLCSP